MAASFVPTLRFYRLSPLWGLALAGDRAALYDLHARLRLPASAPARRRMEGTRACRRAEPAMTASAQLRSGKGAHDENFPVASWLIKRRHRPAIHAFYEFVRVADDIADHPTLAREEKLARLDRSRSKPMHRRRGDEPEGVALRAMLRRHSLPTKHAQDLLNAFRQDVTKLRYAELGRADRLLLALGDAGRPLRARRARRVARDLAGQRRALCRAADHQSPAGLRRPTTAHSIASIFRSTRWRRTALASKRSAKNAPVRLCGRACVRWPSAPCCCCSRARASMSR